MLERHRSIVALTLSCEFRNVCHRSAVYARSLILVHEHCELQIKKIIHYLTNSFIAINALTFITKNRSSVCRPQAIKMLDSHLVRPKFLSKRII